MGPNGFGNPVFGAKWVHFVNFSSQEHGDDEAHPDPAATSLRPGGAPLRPLVRPAFHQLTQPQGRIPPEPGMLGSLSGKVCRGSCHCGGTAVTVDPADLRFIHCSEVPAPATQPNRSIGGGLGYIPRTAKTRADPPALESSCCGPAAPRGAVIGLGCLGEQWAQIHLFEDKYSTEKYKTGTNSPFRRRNGCIVCRLDVGDTNFPRGTMERHLPLLT
jgi:hypothetical protein